MTAEYAKKQYRTVGLTIFIISVALAVMRIVSYYVSVAMVDSALDGAWVDLMLDAVFSVPLQIGILFLFPMLMYKFALKKPIKEVFSFSGYRKCDIRICLMSVLLGITVLGVAQFLSALWLIFLMILGYNPSGGGELPASFHFGYFIATVILTALLPAVCEEFTNRGGLLTTMRGSFSKSKTILIIALAFGLFHENITQIFYTAAMGALLAYLTLETKSVIPAMIVHFMNNFTSILMDNAQSYGWFFGGVYDFASSSVALLGAFSALCLAASFGLVCAIVKLSKKQRKENYYLELSDEIALSGFKPELKDNAFFIGAVVMTVISTLLTFIFGL